MKTFRHIFIFFTLLSVALFSFAGEHEGKKQHQHDHGKGKMAIEDNRIALNLPEKMQQRQLAKMRQHLEAVNTIIGMIAEGQFEQASAVAADKLGKGKHGGHKMCKKIDNEQFKELGMAFHASGDTLAETLKKGDTQASLKALNNTVSYCVQCHAAFKH